MRRPAVAGLFYPADASRLHAEIGQHLAGVQRRAEPPHAAPKILIVPHAGYIYSGPVAAHAYARLAPWRDRISRVVLLGPAHRVALRGMALPGAAELATPLGRVPVDRAAVELLREHPEVLFSDAAHAEEHSLEVQLPFLQVLLGEFSLVPLVVGAVRGETVARVLDLLWGGDETLILISSDLSHYHDDAQCRLLDRATVRRILSFEPVLNHEQACGATPINGALRAARQRGLEPRLLDLRHSGDTAGPKHRVVGYCAIEFGDTGAQASSGGTTTSVPRST